MKARVWGGIALFLASVLLFCGDALADPQLPARTSSVVDIADLLQPYQEQPLATRLSTFKARSGVDLVVVTLPSLQGYPIEQWGRSLGNGWSVGGKSGLGALLIVAPNDRQVRIEIGDALAVMLSDSTAASIIDNDIIPNFRDGRMSAGVLAGVDAIIDEVTRPAGADVESAQSAPEVKEVVQHGFDWIQSMLPSQSQVLIGVLILLVALIIYKTVVSPLARSLRDYSDDDFSGRTVYRDDRDSFWYASSRDPVRRSEGSGRANLSGGFSGFGSSGIFGSSSGSSGFGGSGSSSSFGGSSGGRSSGGGFGGRGASGRW